MQKIATIDGIDLFLEIFEPDTKIEDAEWLKEDMEAFSEIAKEVNSGELQFLSLKITCLKDDEPLSSSIFRDCIFRSSKLEDLKNDEQFQETMSDTLEHAKRILKECEDGGRF